MRRMTQTLAVAGLLASLTLGAARPGLAQTDEPARRPEQDCPTFALVDQGLTPEQVASLEVCLTEHGWEYEDDDEVEYQYEETFA